MNLLSVVSVQNTKHNVNVTPEGPWVSRPTWEAANPTGSSSSTREMLRPGAALAASTPAVLPGSDSCPPQAIEGSFQHPCLHLLEYHPLPETQSPVAKSVCRTYMSNWQN